MLKKLIVGTLLALNLSLVSGNVAAAQFIPLPEDEYSDTFVDAQGDSALEKTAYITSKVITAARYLIAAIVILLGIVAAIQMIGSNGNEEGYEKGKKSLVWSVVGLVIIALSADLAQIIELTNGGLLGPDAELLSRTRLFDGSVRIVITFIKYIIGAVGVLMLVRSGLRMATLGSNEEEVTKDRKNILYVSVGLIALIFVDTLVRRVLYKIDNPLENPTIDYTQGIREIAGFANLLVSFVGPLAVTMLVIAGIMYLANFGNEETQTKAKKMIIASLIGIIMIYGAFGVVSTIIIGRF